MIHETVFSCAGTTRRIADSIAEGLGGKVAVHDLLDKDFQPFAIESAEDVEDVVLFAVPVWGGRVPSMAAERLRQINGNGQKAVAVAVYGNRDYDDALLELCDIASEQGFKVVSAAAFVAEHCIFPAVAAGRPDVSDNVAVSRFINETKKSIAENKTLDLSLVKGNRPYKKSAGVPINPKTVKDKCVECRVCVENCPTDAIDPETLATDADKCISCCRCIHVCSNDARKFGGLMYKTVRFAFEKLCSKRHEPELFF